MYNISIFVEDRAHEAFITTLAQCLADIHQISINFVPLGLLHLSENFRR